MKSPSAERLLRVSMDYSNNFIDVPPPIAWLRAHAVVDELLTICEHSIEDPDWEPRTRFLGHVEMPRLFSTYQNAVSIGIKIEGHGRKSTGRVILTVEFLDKLEHCLFLLRFTIQAWGHISRVENTKGREKVSREFKRIVLWCLVNGVDYPGLPREEMKISSLMPLLNTLFPGINYYSTTGFHQVMYQCAKPVLRKLFPELVGASDVEVAKDATAMVKVTEFLPSKGYEWQDSDKWKLKFIKLLEAK